MPCWTRQGEPETRIKLERKGARHAREKAWILLAILLVVVAAAAFVTSHMGYIDSIRQLEAFGPGYATGIATGAISSSFSAIAPMHLEASHWG